ncbi:MAG TPA: UvrD-helicase domain-containing protein [Steroidobacteraceae bacterium]|nr:UvrD-helicase domain-containing protein [Steroidobacteraceae bacterium]
MRDDREVRLRALDPAGSFIVQAPAGSGKTELLTQRFLRLLTTVEHPEQILAITFTRKAAAEMRKRIFDALHASREVAPESAHKRATWELARAVSQIDEQKRWRLIEQPARLRIQTIDALNAMLARRLPVVAGLGAPLEPTDDTDPLYYEAGARLIERLGEGTEDARAVERLIVHLGNRVDRFVELLADLLGKRDQWLGAIVDARDTGELRATLEQALEGVIARHLEQLCRGMTEERRSAVWELTHYAAENLLRNGSLDAERRRMLEACSRAGARLGEGIECLEAWRAVADVFLTDKGELYRKVNAVQGFPPQPAAMKQRMMQLLDELREDDELCAQLSGVRHLPHPVYSEDQWQALQALLAVLPLAVAELQLVFQARGQADYVEAALRALRALGSDEQPTDLALAFDYRLQHILIDEFQDTSYAQLELLERLTAGWQSGDGRTLFCVGDPMQSIYRFRQAEVGLFLQLQQSGLRNVTLEPLTLTSNFRSIPAVVSWVNEVFPRVLSSRSDPELGAVAYSPSEAALPEAQGGVFVHPSVETDAMDEAREVSELVHSLLDRDATSRIAILVSARNHVAAIADELSRNEIDFQAVEIEMLADRPVVQDLIALTRALVHVGDRTAWLAVLRAPWCGLSLPDLHSLCGKAADGADTILEALRASATVTLSAAGAARVQRIQTILEPALRERGRLSLREWVERTWVALGGPATLQREQDLDDAESYLQRLESIEITGDLEDVAALESQLARLFARPRAQRGRVEVMTIHKAKGLEFDCVILPSLQRYTKGEDRELLRWMRVAGPRGGIVFAPIKAEGADPDPVYRWLALLERERTLRERARLLYVAATRAKRELHLFGSVKAKTTDDGLTFAEPRQTSLLRMLWHAVKPAFEGALDDPHARATQFTEPTPLTTLRRLPLDWAVPQSRETSALIHARLLATPKRPPDFDWVSETGRHIGTIVHRELERMTRGAAGGTANGQQLVRERISLELAELGVPEERRELALARVVEAIDSALSDERGRWLLGLQGDLGEAESELALTGFVRGQLIDGVIDRTFRDASGVRWIVDFKTSTHEGAGLEHFLAEEENRYRDQLTRYAELMRAYKPNESVRAALYFPLLKEWREVNVA